MSEQSTIDRQKRRCIVCGQVTVAYAFVGGKPVCCWAHLASWGAAELERLMQKDSPKPPLQDK
jgi:hypothetical protein